jgi:hypothetical protein
MERSYLSSSFNGVMCHVIKEEASSRMFYTVRLSTHHFFLILHLLSADASFVNVQVHLLPSVLICVLCDVLQYTCALTPLPSPVLRPSFNILIISALPWVTQSDILFYCNLFYCIVLHSILFILFYSILFYSLLFYSILFYSILFYSILFYSILFYSILLFYSIILYSILFYSILFYSILFYYILFNLFYSIILNSILLKINTIQ